MVLNDKTILALALSILWLAPAAQGEPPAAEEVLEKTIAFHDPTGNWPHGAFRLTVRTKTAEGVTLEKEVVIDNGRGRYELHQTVDGQRIAQKLDGDVCTFEIDGRTALSQDELAEHRLECRFVRQWRDYHGFLWGLPMKIRDPGAQLDPVVRSETFQGRDVLALRVTYDPAVGSDVWYLYLDPASYGLVGYEFFKDEEKNVGEYIVLTDEMTGAGLRLPRKRAWYFSQDDKYLGTDSLTALGAR